MKRLLYLLSIALLFTACSDGEEFSAESQLPALPQLPELSEPEELPTVNDVLSVVEDNYFARYCLVRFDTNGDGMLSMAEAERVERIVRDEDPTELQEDHAWFTSMKGIEYFKNLERLEVRSSVMTELDLSYNTKLRELSFILPQNMSRLKRLNISNTQLEELEVPLSELEELLVSGSRLEKLCVNLTDSKLKSLDVRYCEDLKQLEVLGSALSTLDVRYCARLRSLVIVDSQLQSIDLTRNSELEILTLANARLAAINLQQNSQIESLNLEGNQLAGLALTNLKKLQHLNLSGNPIQVVDIKDLEQLKSLDVQHTYISVINTDNNTNLESLDCRGARVKSLDLTTNRGVRYLDCSENQMTNLSLGANPNLATVICSNNSYISLDFSQLKISTWSDASDNQTGSSFAPQAALELLTLPATTKQVALSQLNACPKLRKVILNAVTVPELRYEGPITPSQATLYVPSEAIASYESSPWAEAFKEVRSL